MNHYHDDNNDDDNNHHPYIVAIFIILTITPISMLLFQVREGEAISSINGEDAVNLTREVGTSTWLVFLRSEVEI